MRIIVAIVALLAVPGLSFAQGFEVGPGGIRVHPGYGHHREYGGGYRPDCRELRAACMHKEELGEEGAGNCRRYRELCGRR
jgi:hypothetical protein